MKINHIRVGGQTFAVCLNLNALEEIAALAGDGTMDEHGNLRTLDVSSVLGYASSVTGMANTMAVLIREGERLEGRTTEVDADWIKSRVSVGELPWMQKKIMAIILLATRMETEGGDDEEIDEVLEEIKKKETEAASRSGS